MDKKPQDYHVREKALRAKYNATPEGKFLLEMGREYYDTESSARCVAEFAVKKIAILIEALQAADKYIVNLEEHEGCEGFSKSTKELKDIYFSKISSSTILPLLFTRKG